MTVPGIAVSIYGLGLFYCPKSIMVFSIQEVYEIDNNKVAREIMDLVGGTENVISVTHCVTRLRFKLKDQDKADREALDKHEGVVTVREASGQFQVVIGNHVPAVYKAVVTEGGFKTEKQEQEDEDRDDEKKGLLNSFIDIISNIFLPILPLLMEIGRAS